MGFGARLVLGLSIVFFSFSNHAYSQVDLSTEEIAVDELIEGISGLSEYVPALGDAGLSKKVAEAEALARKQDYVAAAAIVSDVKFQLIGLSLGDFSYVGDLKKWSDYGFFPPSDASRDLLVESVGAVAHIRDEFNSPNTSQEARHSALVRFIALQNLVSAFRLRQDSAPYALNAEIKKLSHELLFQLLYLDSNRRSVSEQAATRVTEATERLGQLSSRFAELKKQEGISGAILVLNQLKALGPPKTDPEVIRYDAIPLAIEQVEKQGEDTGSYLQAAVTSPYQNLFASSFKSTDASEHLQILKLELARRVLEDSKYKSAIGEVSAKIGKLVQTAGPQQFWLQVEDIRSHLNRVTEQVALNPMGDSEDAGKLAALAPDVMQTKAQNLAGAYALMVDRLDQNFATSSTTWQKLNPWAQRRSLKSLQEISYALRLFSQNVSTARNPAAISEIARSLHWIQVITGYAVEAAMVRSKTAPAYAALLRSVASGLESRKALVTEAHIAEIRRLMKIELSEGIFRAWVNKDTVTTAALSALLVGEAVSVVYTGGASAAAMPATIAAIKALSIAGRTVMWMSRGIIAASAGSNLVDRYRVGGWTGLANMESALDALMVLAVLPRLPLATPTAKLATGRVGQIGQWMIRKTAEVQFTSTRLLSQLMIAYSGYQLVYAESIAEEYRRMGVQITPTEVRARAALGLALSALVFYKDRQALAQARVANPEYAAQFEKGLSLSQTRLSHRLKGMINPYAAARDFYRVRPSWYRAIGGAAVGLGYAGMDYLLINEGILLAHTNPDFNYMNQVERENPFPVLKEGESALAMVGLSPLDTLLYFGSHADFSHRRERELFGSSYQVENFQSPENLVEKLVQHAAVHGPIRYLKIMTHGRPGMLYSQAVDLVGDDSSERAVAVNLQTFLGSGWIDKDWLDIKRAWIRERARKAFAPDARIVLWACLTGANYDPPKFGGQPEEPINIGDQFLASLGKSFLPEGGSIDASTRILIGLGSVFGSALNEATYAGRKVDEHYRPVVPVVPLDSVPRRAEPSDAPNSEQNITDLAFDRVGPGFFQASLLVTGSMATAAPAGAPMPAAWDSIRYTAGRAQYMLTYMPQLWWKYGIMLEGPWWHEWYQHVEVPATAD
jgi:hypothetical protein